MQFLLLSACLTVCATPVWAQDLLSVASGNWGGTDNDGFYFRAQLMQESATARLLIWNGIEGVPVNGDPQLDNPDMVLSAFARENGQRLEVVESPEGTILQVITEFADEAAEGRVTVQIQYLDNQFTVIAFEQQDFVYEQNDTYTCSADLWNGKVTVNGRTSDLPPRSFEALNASGWTYSAAFDRGICPRPE